VGVRGEEGQGNMASQCAAAPAVQWRRNSSVLPPREANGGRRKEHSEYGMWAP